MNSSHDEITRLVERQLSEPFHLRLNHALITKEKAWGHMMKAVPTSIKSGKVTVTTVTLFFTIAFGVGTFAMPFLLPAAVVFGWIFWRSTSNQSEKAILEFLKTDPLRAAHWHQEGLVDITFLKPLDPPAK